MMVRGDGTLMTDGLARAKPIETILSGPAASALGAIHLSGHADCFVMDIGGTTTDIVHVSGGRPGIPSNGARIGDWSTRVRAAEVFTVGLGGDSRIHLDGNTRLRIGPQRSASYSLAVGRYPHLVGELEEILSNGSHRQFLHHDQEAYALVRTSDGAAYSSEERILIERLRHTPHTLHHLNRSVGLPGTPAILAELTKSGVVERISLTPTDVWHVRGQYVAGDVHAAALALQITAEMQGTSPEDLVERVLDAMRQQVELSAAWAAVLAEGQDLDLEEWGAAAYSPNQLCFPGRSRTLPTLHTLSKPVVGIGAPAATWLGNVPGLLVFHAEVPEHAEVANAIGAAIAHAVETVDVLIRRDTVSGLFLVFSPNGRQALVTLEEATAVAIRHGEEFLARLTRASDLRVESQVKDFQITNPGGDSSLFVERVICLTARLEP